MKRYDHFCSYDGGGPADAEESPDGEFVRYGDAMAEIERLRAVALEHVPHAYEGDCPDELDRTRRDRNCPACRLLGAA
jgi:hypothetical protein